MAGLLPPALEAAACTCPAPLAPAEALDASAAVFSGAVVDTRIDTALNLRTVTLHVDRAWKGVDDTPVVVVTPANEASCGFPFQQAGQYLVYATYRSTGELETTLCTRTNAVEAAIEDRAALGEGYPVAVVRPGIPETHRLEQNYPNPFERATWVPFMLQQTTHVVLRLYDARGQPVGTYLDRVLPTGGHTVRIDPGRLPPGVYLYELQVGEQRSRRAMVRVR